jgi:hypothetical protein
MKEWAYPVQVVIAGSPNNERLHEVAHAVTCLWLITQSLLDRPSVLESAVLRSANVWSRQCLLHIGSSHSHPACERNANTLSR